LAPESVRALARIWRNFALDRSAHVAILSGEGPSFCAGMYLKLTDPGFGRRRLAGEQTGLDEPEMNMWRCRESGGAPTRYRRPTSNHASSERSFDLSLPNQFCQRDRHCNPEIKLKPALHDMKLRHIDVLSAPGFCPSRRSYR
jgi:hypothetical protein